MHLNIFTVKNADAKGCAPQTSLHSDSTPPLSYYHICNRQMYLIKSFGHTIDNTS